MLPLSDTMRVQRTISTTRVEGNRLSGTGVRGREGNRSQGSGLESFPVQKSGDGAGQSGVVRVKEG